MSTVKVSIEVEVPVVKECPNCGNSKIKHDACHNNNTEYWYECQTCDHNWYVNEGGCFEHIVTKGKEPEPEQEPIKVGVHYKENVTNTMYGEISVPASIVNDPKALAEYVDEHDDELDKVVVIDRFAEDNLYDIKLDPS